jgi:small conductance mechanosensitive channel
MTVLARTRTIRSLLKNLIDAVLLLITLLIILSSWGVNIIPILTGAGVLGLAFSFGAQTLVKDIIAGFFIILEDQFDVGDTVEIAKIEGEVYKMTLRVTVLKDKKENLIYIPNSQITTVKKLKSP